MPQVFWCRKHGFCPQGEQAEHCFAQNYHKGCKNLTQLPTIHPKITNKLYNRAKRKKATLIAIRRAGL